MDLGSDDPSTEDYKDQGQSFDNAEFTFKNLENYQDQGQSFDPSLNLPIRT